MEIVKDKVTELFCIIDEYWGTIGCDLGCFI